MLPTRFVFWQPIPSMHQLPFIEAFTGRVGGEVSCVCGEAVTPDRIALGWTNPSAALVPLSTPPLGESLAAIAAAGPETLQVFSGMHCHPYVNTCFRKAVTARAPIALISESYDPRGVRGLIRRVRSRWDAIRVGAAIRAIFAMGEVGERWFRVAGFPGDRIHSFAYVTPVSPEREPAAETHADFRILYVGQLIPRKGVDLLLQSLAICRQADWRLTIVGNGPAECDLKQLAVLSGILDRVTWVKSVPNTEIARMMAGHDLLVLPSRYDGWGAVVNEALTVGTPVVCSEACGAADLIRSALMGEVTRAGSVASLATALRRRINAGSPRPDVRRQLAAAAERFSPSSVAGYFLAAIEASFGGGVAPCPPWRAAP